jgi:hypothetical protein
MSFEPWYAAKCIFRHSSLPAEEGAFVYEERVLLVRAASIDDAMAKAETEARHYGSDGIEYLGFVDVYHLFAESLGDHTEAYSLMRSSTLAPTDYLNRFHDTGTEHSKNEKSAT